MFFLPRFSLHFFPFSELVVVRMLILRSCLSVSGRGNHFGRNLFSFVLFLQDLLLSQKQLLLIQRAVKVNWSGLTDDNLGHVLALVAWNLVHLKAGTFQRPWHHLLQLLLNCLWLLNCHLVLPWRHLLSRGIHRLLQNLVLRRKLLLMGLDILGLLLRVKRLKYLLLHNWKGLNMFCGGLLLQSSLRLLYKMLLLLWLLLQHLLWLLLQHLLW